MWNAQYITYAGYKNEDGTITGDPAYVEFTDVIIIIYYTFLISLLYYNIIYNYYLNNISFKLNR